VKYIYGADRRIRRWQGVPIDMPLAVVYTCSRVSANRQLAALSRDVGISPVITSSPHDVTRLLIQLTDGNRTVLNELLPLVYGELRSLAANYLRRERSGHTLQPTALVHEAYLRLVDQNQVRWQNRAHFFGVAAQMMRRILVDHARGHNAGKRGSDFQKLSLDENIDVSGERAADIVALDDALRELAVIDEQKSRIVELRFFGGLSVEETAEVLGVSAPTVKRQWRMAKAWLYGQVKNSDE